MPRSRTQKWYLIVFSCLAITYSIPKAVAIAGERGPNELFRVVREGSSDFLQLNELPAPEGVTRRNYTFDLCRKNAPTQESENFCSSLAFRRSNGFTLNEGETLAYNYVCNARTEGISTGYHAHPVDGRAPFSWGYYDYTCATLERFSTSSLEALINRQHQIASTSETVLTLSRTALLYLATDVAGRVFSATIEGMTVGEAAEDVGITVRASFLSRGRELVNEARTLARTAEARQDLWVRAVLRGQRIRGNIVTFGRQGRQATRAAEAAAQRLAETEQATREIRGLLTDLRIARGALRSNPTPLAERAVAEAEAQISHLQSLVVRRAAAAMEVGEERALIEAQADLLESNAA